VAVQWKKKAIEIAPGNVVLAQSPMIISASRSTDIPAFYSDWFISRLERGFVTWFNPFNNSPLYVSLTDARLFVFWSKNPKPMLEPLPGHRETPIDVLESLQKNYYFQVTMNDYDLERIEPNVPPLDERISTFIRLSKRIGGAFARDRIVWRFDPLIITDKLTPRILLERISRIGDRIAPYTSRLVFSFVDISAYGKVAKNLTRGGVRAREFSKEEMLEVAEGVSCLTRGWGIQAGTCGEMEDLPGIEHNRCIDDRLIAKCFNKDRELMGFIGARFVQGNLFAQNPEEREDRWVSDHRKDSGQRKACGCIMSKDIGEYNTCPHLCHYCYANTNNAIALANWERHKTCPYAETITGRMS